MPTRNVDAANQYQSYMRGWKHAASTKAMDPVFTEHSNELIVEAYNRGYSDGSAAKQRAYETASATYGYEPSILRLAESHLAEDG